MAKDSKFVKAADDATFKALLKSSKHVVVDFWAPWCGPCKQYGPILEKAADKHQAKMAVLSVDTDSTNVADPFNIAALPTTIIFRNGKEIAREEGAMNQKTLEAWLSEYEVI